MYKQSASRKEVSAGWAGLAVVAALLIGAGYFYIQSMQHEGLSTLVDWVYMAGLLVAAALIGLVSLLFVIRKKIVASSATREAIQQLDCRNHPHCHCVHWDILYATLYRLTTYHANVVNITI